MIDFQIPLAGLDRASAAVDRAATRIAASSTSPGDTVDLSAEAVALLEARNSFSANVKVVQAYDEMSRSFLNALG